MFHYHIITRNDSEIIKKIYMKQRGSHIKGDWFRMLLKDFQFIEQDMDDNAIKNTPNYIYYKEIKKKVNAGALKYFIKK